MNSFPSKTFLLGEYCVLEGAPALLLAHDPLFQSHFHESPQECSPFRNGSPAARLASQLGLDARRFSFHDPHQGKGGFGASGAEFLAVARQNPAAPLDPLEFAWHARAAYLNLGEAGSGADILLQALEKKCLLAIDISKRTLEELPLRLGAVITLFHTGIKLSTHEHLHTLRSPQVLDLVPLTLQARQAYLQGSCDLFAAAINAFGRGLADRGLLANHSAKALSELRSVDGILAAKGCGAMGNDVLLVLSRAPLPLRLWAKEHSLVEVAQLEI